MLKQGIGNLNIASGLSSWTEVGLKVTEISELFDESQSAAILAMDSEGTIDAGVLVKSVRVADEKGVTSQRIAWYGDTSDIKLSEYLAKMSVDKPFRGMNAHYSKVQRGLQLIFEVKSGGTGYDKEMLVTLDNAHIQGQGSFPSEGVAGLQNAASRGGNLGAVSGHVECQCPPGWNNFPLPGRCGASIKQCLNTTTLEVRCCNQI